MYKMTIDEHESLTSYSLYLNTSYVSFLLFLPCFIIKLLYMRYSDENFSHLSVRFDAEVGEILLAASVFNFLYNLLSIIVLAKLATLTHSLINVTKRIFVVYSTLLFFSTAITSAQIVGLALADSGLVLYTYLKLKMNTKDTMTKAVKHLTKIRVKNCMCIVIVVVLCASCLAELSRKGPQATEGFKVPKNPPRVGKEYFNKLELDNSMRILCLNNIKDQIKSVFEPLIPKDKDIYVTYIPEHPNIGDTLIW